MPARKILVLGATGMLGRPVVRHLVAKGHQVRILARDPEKARQIFGNTVEIIAGNALNRDAIRAAIAGCQAVHINLTQEVELTATQHVIDLAPANHLERLTYVSATTAFEQNRWFELADIKLRTEELLRHSGIAHTVFCPTWVMETLQNFIRPDRAVVIVSKNPPALHFFAATDFGRIVATAYEDDRALGKRLFIHGPQAVTLPVALERFIKACHPGLKVTRMKLWQAQLVAWLTGRQALRDATRLIAYFDKVGEMGDPGETNALYGSPSITLEEWFTMPKDNYKGLPH